MSLDKLYGPSFFDSKTRGNVGLVESSWGQDHRYVEAKNTSHINFTRINPRLNHPRGRGGSYPDKVGGNQLDHATSGDMRGKFLEYHKRLDLSRRQVAYNQATRSHGSAPLHSLWSPARNYHLERSKQRDVNLFNHGLFGFKAL